MSAESSSTLRVPPQFLDGERAILGGALLNNEAMNRVMEILSPDDFYREAHRRIFATMSDLFAKNEPVDWLTLSGALKDSGRLDAVGGNAYLTELIDATPSAANILHYTRVVREKSLLRTMISAATEVATRCYEDQDNLDQFFDEAEALIFSVSEQSHTKAGLVQAKELMKASIDTVQALYDRKEHVTGIPSGFNDLDLLTAGFQPSDLIIVAGRPSMGKTSLALNMGIYAAVEGGVPTAVFSLEMSKQAIALRMLCSKARVNLKSLRTGYLSLEDWRKLQAAAGMFYEAPLYVDDTPAINALEIRSKARRLKKEKGLGLVIVDYLQLMKGAVRADSREKEISDISRSLKAVAKELDVPVIALSQLNRKVEDRPNKRPQLADLRESGAIEQDADVIIFIYRDEVYNKSDDNPKKGEAEIIIGKQRNGPIGTVTAFFDAQYSTFRPHTRRDEIPVDESALLGNI